MVHGVVEMLRRLKVSSNVPAAPWLPDREAESAPPWHAVEAAPAVDVVVEAGAADVDVVPVVAVVEVAP